MTRREFLAVAGALTIDRMCALGADAGSAELPSNIQVGVIGFAGHYSEVTNIAKSNAQFVAICDPNAATLERVGRAANLRSARQYTDYRKMLEMERLDVVAVCGENEPRARIIQDCAERDLAIMTEKPLALSLRELGAVKRAVERHRVPLSMLLTMRCAPPYLAMREVVQQGQIGEVVSMDAQKSYQLGTRPDWMKARRTLGGTIPYVGIHMLDLMRWISGREFTQVAAFHSSVRSPEIGEMENNAALAFKLDNNGSASMRIDYLRPAAAKTHGDDRLRIVGARGIVECQNERVTLVTEDEAMREIAPLPTGKSLFIDFLESIYLAKPHILPKGDIFRISEVVLKAREAADTGKVVRLGH
jgi:predicted dehydrogenase